jgi:hypothetical protein
MTTTTTTQTAISAILIAQAEEQIRQAQREQERQAHIAALNAMQEHQIRDDEGWAWRTDELTTLLSEDLKQTIENSGCLREIVFSALLGLFSPYAGLEICTVHDESYAKLEEILSKEQWADHSDDADEDETTDE